MKINHRIRMDLIRKRIPPRIDAVQNDAGSRILQLELLADERPWMIPEDTRVTIRYSKPDRTAGHYDTLPDGTSAWTARGNELFITLAPQVLTVPGTVELSVTMSRGITRLTTFAILIDVQRCSSFRGTSEDYFYVSAFLPQVTGGARLGQHLRVSKVDGKGNILALEAVSTPGSGLDPQSKTLLLELLRGSVYVQDVSETIAQLEQLWSEAPQVAAPTGISAVYNGGDVEAGTSLGYFLDKVAVTRYYSDGSSITLDGTQYAIGGTDIVIGANVVLITDLETGMSATFTVMGIAPLYTVTTTLLEEKTGNSTRLTASTAQGGSSFSMTLAVPDRYDLAGITVTMGGKDISSTAVDGMRVSIGKVTGDIAVAMTVREKDAVFFTVTKRLTNVTCSGASSAQENGPYEASLTVQSGYTLKTVVVSMGSVDITASVYSGGIISIPAVTGNIVITATAANDAVDATMTAISVEYTGGDVAIGTAVTDLKGITVTAHYSDGTTKNVEKYAITGTIEAGSNPITVSFNGFNTHFTVNGVENAIPSTCMISNNMTNASTNNTLPAVAGGGYYTAKITADEGYVLESVTVTMAGTDVTASVYDASSGWITIEAVTGNVVITAVAKEA